MNIVGGLMLLVGGSAFAGGWQPVPMVSTASRASGCLGGEGGQWPRAMAVDAHDGMFVLWGTDVGGLYRSLDGGASWEPCNVGYAPRGTAALAIDPGNPDRVLSVGANSVAFDGHGLWLSEDRAASWRHVLPATIGGSHDRRVQVAFDPYTFDAPAGFTRRVYWSRIAEDRPSWGTPEIRPGVWRSDDGGRTWREIPGSARAGGAILKIRPSGGRLYAGVPDGLLISDDGGASFRRTFTGTVTGLDVSRYAPDRVWLSTPRAIWRSDDAGVTFRRLPASPATPDGILHEVSVSPADPERLTTWREAPQWRWTRHASSDGGATWNDAVIDSAGAFLPYNVRQGIVVWHQTDPRVGWSTGGDWPTRTEDGGATWRWSGDGVNGMLVGGAWSFSLADPDVVFVGSQDYYGAVTIDGGATWRYTNVSGHGWGGFCYGGYAATRQLLVAGKADGWGSPRELRVSFDGGREALRVRVHPRTRDAWVATSCYGIWKHPPP